MINDKAKKLLEINDPQDFQEFSRKAITYNRIEECNEYQINENQIQRNIIDQLKLVQKGQKYKKTLENRIIQIFKKSLSNQQKSIANSNFLKEKIIESDLKGHSGDANNDMTNNQQKGQFYALFQNNESQTFQKLPIKASIFQNQTDYYYCLVIDEVNDEQRIKILQKITIENKQNFFQFCLYLGDKLQNIISNISNQPIVQANVLQCYNKIYNYKDQAQIIKNQFNKHFLNLKITQISLGDLKDQIIQRFADKVKEIDIQISYIKCHSHTLINTQADKFMQPIINLIDNSIKFLQKIISNKQLFGKIIRIRVNNNNSFSSQKSIKSFNQQVLNSNNLDIYSKIQLLNQQKIKQKIQILEEDEDSKSSFSLQYSYSSNKIDEFFDQNTIQDSNQIRKQFEILLGEQEVSNIIKATVKDYGQGMPLDKIFKMFLILDTKNIDFSSQFQNNSFLGWKVNYHIIGNLGPFYNFFIKSQENQGLEYHFYVFQDINILKENSLSQQVIFKNPQFEISLEQSQNNFQNANKLEELNQISNKNTESLIQNCSNNSQFTQKFIKDKVKANYNFKNSQNSQNS
ncbi:hypothetical protein ABPG72_005683 [Tetrahymena utriculariae]